MQSQHLASENVQGEMKRCSKCKDKKQKSAFYLESRASDGLKGHCKACHMAGTASWKRRHPEAEKAMQHRYRERHKSTLRASVRAWRRANPDIFAERRARWEAANPGWQERRAAAKNTVLKNWRKNNPEAVLELLHRRRARLAGAEGSYAAKDISKLYAEQGGLCANENCRVSIESGFHRDHIQSISTGGSNYIENIQLLCQSCNIMKGHRPMAWLLAKTKQEAHRA